MKRTIVRAAALLLVAAGCGTAPTAAVVAPGGPPVSASARAVGEQELLAADAAFQSDTLARGLEGWMSWYTDDAVRMEIDGFVARGRDAIRAHDAALFANGRTTLHWEPLEAGLQDDGRHGWTRGRYEMRVAFDGATPKVVARGHYLTLWRRVGGDWRVTLDTGVQTPEMRGGRHLTMALRTEINADVPLAAPGEFAPLTLCASIRVWPPVVLAPMAGVTNPPFRTLCRRQGAGLYVAEMLHVRGLTEGNAKTLKLASFGADESVRSIQIFGADPGEMADATRFLVSEVGVHHVDVNMGCPVRKITARGGGSALPARPELMRAVLAAVVRAAGDVPVTTKIRLGLDEQRVTWPDALAAAEGEGCRWLGVHARTAAALYSGAARWDEIARVKERASIPILGNGDIWEAFDALRMMRQTGCDGVIIGRGCLGRPWLFRELADVFEGREPGDPPNLRDVLAVLREHADLLVAFFGEPRAVRELRKWCAWYTKGFQGSPKVRDALARIESIAELDLWLGQLDPDQPFPRSALRVARAKRGGSQDHVSLPHGWLDLAEREQRAARGGAPAAGTVAGDDEPLPTECCDVTQ